VNNTREDIVKEHEKLLIIDFGSQVTKLIARRVRESGVYSEVHPFNKVDAEYLAKFGPKAIILSGGPSSVTGAGSPRAHDAVWASGVPILGICYGQQTMCAQLGGAVESSDEQEFGRAFVDTSGSSPLFAGLSDREEVWMSHGDRVSALPEGFEVIGVSPNAPYAAIADEARKYYGVQYHPEVVHTPNGAKMLRNFTHDIAGFKGDWSMASFKDEMKKVGGAKFLAQGTLYPDVIESVSFDGGPSVTIKSHHNVGGLPERMDLKLVEPLRELFKDEVRALGRELGLHSDFVERHPFPGPGLAIRCPGEITKARLDILREADAVYLDQIKKHGLYNEIWQAFAVLLPVQTVGVMGDSRTYDFVLALRAVTSTDGMTADYYPYSHEFLGETATRIINEVRGVNRVVYDVTSKPPGTIEWE